MFKACLAHGCRPHGEAELARSQWEVEQLRGAQARLRVAFWTMFIEVIRSLLHFVQHIQPIEAMKPETCAFTNIIFIHNIIAQRNSTSASYPYNFLCLWHLYRHNRLWQDSSNLSSALINSAVLRPCSRSIEPLCVEA